MGPSGLILGIIACLASVSALRFFRARFGATSGDVAATVLVAGTALAIAMSGVSLADVLTQMLAPLGRLGDTLWALLAITLIEVLLWAIGIHGPAMLAAVVLPVYLQLQAENTQPSRTTSRFRTSSSSLSFSSFFPGVPARRCRWC